MSGNLLARFADSARRRGPQQHTTLYNRHPSTRGCQKVAQPLWQTPGKWSKSLLFGADRINSSLPAKHPNSYFLSRDSHGLRVGPSRPARRVIGAITGFGPPLPWGLLETGQEGGLLPLSAPTPSADRRASRFLGLSPLWLSPSRRCRHCER